MIWETDGERRWHSMRWNGTILRCWQEILTPLSQLTGITQYKNVKLVVLSN